LFDCKSDNLRAKIWARVRGLDEILENKYREFIKENFKFFLVAWKMLFKIQYTKVILVYSFS
jgi:hypothetical protein